MEKKNTLVKNDEKKELKEVSNLDKTFEHFYTRLNCAQSILATYGPLLFFRLPDMESQIDSRIRWSITSLS